MRAIAKKIVIAYLEGQAKRLLNKHQPKIVAIGGSVGKTSTKMATAKVLAAKYDVLAHPSSYNGEISLPLAMFDLRVPQALYNPIAWLYLLIKIGVKHRHKFPWQVLVLELGTDKPGDIAYFMRYIKPDIGVITAVTPEHMEGFGTMNAVLEEEFDLARASEKVLLNANDPMLATKKGELAKDTVLTFGVKKGDYSFTPEETEDLFEGQKGTVKLHSKDKLKVNLHVVAKHSLFAVAAAAGVGHQLGIKSGGIKNGVEAIKPVPGRMSPLAGKNGAIILDDSYNSSPDAAVAALETLHSFRGRRRKIAVLGSMNELGKYEKEGHESVGRWCGKLSMLITVGATAQKYLIPAAKAAGLSASKIKSFNSPYKAGEYLRKALKPNDIVLIKGSQNGIYTEETVKMVLADPLDNLRLVRQSPFWLKRKLKAFKEAAKYA